MRLVACRHSSAIFFPPSWPLTVSARSPLSLPTMSLYEAPSSRPQSTAISTTDTLPTPTASQEKVKATPSVPSRDFGFLPIPNRVRYDPDHPAHFGLLMNATFGIASTFSTSYLQHLFIPSSTLAVVANLYYCQPLLSEFSFYSWGSHRFSSTLVSIVAVLMKLTLAKHSPILLGIWSDLSRGGEHTHTRASWVSDPVPYLLEGIRRLNVFRSYAVGLLFITPLGDLVRRRPLILILTFITASLTIGLAITSKVEAFEVLCFFVGVFNVVPQILMPLAVDLAPPERRASALSIVLAGLLLGVLIARVLAGVVAQFVTWRVVYYIAIGVQYLILLVLYWMLPDYPAKNKGASYFSILYSMGKFCVTEPLLVQAILISVPSSATFTNWWVTLTFLLGGPPYNYST